MCRCLVGLRSSWFRHDLSFTPLPCCFYQVARQLEGGSSQGSGDGGAGGVTGAGDLFRRVNFVEVRTVLYCSVLLFFPPVFCITYRTRLCRNP